MIEKSQVPRDSWERVYSPDRDLRAECQRRMNVLDLGELANLRKCPNDTATSFGLGRVVMGLCYSCKNGGCKTANNGMIGCARFA